MRDRRGFLALAALLVAGTATGAERLPVVPLDGPGLRRLCDVVRPDSQVAFPGNEVQRGKAREEHKRRREAALEKFYQVTVPAAGFAFREYEVTEQHLAVEARRPLAVAETVEVNIPPGDEEPPELVASLPPAQAEQVVRLRIKGKLGLRLTFRLEADASGDPCSRVVAKRVRVGIDALAFELVETGKAVLYRGELPGYQEAVYATVPVKGPRVKLGKPTVTGGMSAADLAAGFKLLEPGLLACYRRGLEQNARLRGALVVGFRVEGGRVTHAQSEINSLGEDAVVRCAVDRVRAQRFAAGRGGARVSLPVYFGSEED